MIVICEKQTLFPFQFTSQFFQFSFSLWLPTFYKEKWESLHIIWSAHFWRYATPITSCTMNNSWIGFFLPKILTLWVLVEKHFTHASSWTCLPMQTCQAKWLVHNMRNHQCINIWRISGKRNGFNFFQSRQNEM